MATLFKNQLSDVMNDWHHEARVFGGLTPSLIMAHINAVSSGTNVILNVVDRSGHRHPVCTLTEQENDHVRRIASVLDNTTGYPSAAARVLYLLQTRRLQPIVNKIKELYHA
jgi:hypothetical protein